MSAVELTRELLEDFPLPKQGNGDKHDHGKLLVVAGSRSVPGAAVLCAEAAMRAGAGKLQIATVESIAVQLGIAVPESRSVGLAEASDGGFADSAVDDIAGLAADVDAVVAGPGLLESSACERIAGELVNAGTALALDAGILRSLRPHAGQSKHSMQPPVLLPHSGEMASLLACDQDAVEADPEGCGRACAELYGAITLMKGADSRIVHPDGRLWLYRGRTPGLGVSGSGDVIAGIVGGLLARGADPLAALLWGVVLHGEAGNALSRKIGKVGFLAREIPDEIPALLSD